MRRGWGRMFGMWRRRGSGRGMGRGGGAMAGEHAPIEPQDEEAVRRLRDQGKDLTKPVMLVHTFVFASQRAADDAAGRLRRRGFQVAPATTAGPTGPRLTATSASAVDAQAVADIRARMTRFARHHGGEYEGWQPA